MHAVIVGNGVAGMEAALGLRAADADARITIVSEESDHFFSRTALMWVHSGQLSHRDIEPLERDAYARHGFDRVRARATSIDAEAHALHLSSGETLEYDALLIACGSRPRRGPWPGSDHKGVGHFVSLQDLEWYERELRGGPSRAGRPPRPDHHVATSSPSSPYYPRDSAAERRGRLATSPAIIGGGLIGIEAVEVAQAMGLRPHFFVREEWFWPMALNRAEATWITERMSEHGVLVHLEHEVEAIEADPDGLVTAVKTDEGTYDADCVVIAIGVVPNTDWLDGSGLEMERGGIAVDANLRTSLPDVFAAGDCASVPTATGGRRPEQLWYTARDQGRVAARSMLGHGDATYARGTWYNSAKLMDIEYTTAGLVNMEQPDETEWFFEERGDVRSTTRIVLSGGQVIGFNLLGRRWDHTVLIRFIEERRGLDAVLDDLHLALFDSEFVPPLRFPREGSR